MKKLLTILLTLIVVVSCKKSAEEQYKLGEKYFYGTGVERDYTKAIEWYKKSAEQGNARAQYQLGLMYFNGNGTDENKRKAIFWIKKAKDKGLKKAIKIWIEEDLQEIYDFNVIEEQAENGNAEVQYQLSEMYSTGNGVFANIDKSTYWLKRSAESGNVNAQYELAEAYYNSCWRRDIQQDYKKAYYWYEKNRDNGNKEAQYKLNEMYRNGQGTDIYSNEHISNSIECSLAKKIDSIVDIEDLKKIEKCFKSEEAKVKYLNRVRIVKEADQLKKKGLKNVKINKRKLVDFMTNRGCVVKLNIPKYFTSAVKFHKSKDILFVRFDEQKGYYILGYKNGDFIDIEKYFKSKEMRKSCYNRLYYIRKAEECLQKKLYDIRISREKLADFIYKLDNNVQGGSLPLYLTYQKLSNKTFMLRGNWGGSGSLYDIITNKNGKFIKVDLDPNKIITKSLDKVVDDKTNWYDRLAKIDTVKIKGKTYYEIFFSSSYNATCCYSYAVAYNTDFDYKGKFYYKQMYDKYDSTNYIGDKNDWKELKLIEPK